MECGVLPPLTSEWEELGAMNGSHHCFYFSFRHLQCTRHIFISSSQPNEVGAVLLALQVKLRPETVNSTSRFTLLISRTKIFIKS